MTEMLAFCQFLLDSICEFLITPPVFYIVAIVLLLAVVKVIKQIIS